jgi:hypothetical protein
MAAELQAAADAAEEHLKELAARLAGGHGQNYIPILCDFLAHEYKWGLEEIARLDTRQMVMFIEQALRRRAQTGNAGGLVGDEELPPGWDPDAWEELQSLPRRLLRHMLQRKSDAVTNVAEAVWGKDGVKSGTISTAISRANTFLVKQRDRRVLSMRDGVIRWDEPR